MSKTFGIPYIGSKTKIAIDILKRLPSGNRFVDLFGGGFAMTHAAILTKRYDNFFYNDYNPLTVDLVKRAYNGEYNYKVFKPEFITREKFFENRFKDGYIKFCYSFGNDGLTYAYGKEAEHIKHAAHDFVVFGEWSDILNNIDPRLKQVVKSKSIKKRREEFSGYCRKILKRNDLEHLEHLERLERLQHLERLEHLERTICFNCGSYLDYEYQEGDIVYCDPPYEFTKKYDEPFNTKEFYNWAASRNYRLWFSSYKISDDRFRLVWAKRHTTSLGTWNNTKNFECLYTNK